MRVLLLCLCLALAVGAEPPSKQQLFKALEAFHANPLAKTDKNANYKTIMTFATESPMVTVVIGKDVTPWIAEDRDSEWAGVLLLTFVAANVEAQLNTGKNGEQAEAGLTAAFAMYGRIRAKDSIYHSPGLERLQTLAKEGKLKAYLKTTGH